MATSGVMNENSMRKLAVPEARPRHRSRARANPTPSGTAISTVRPASFRLCTSAERRVGSCHTELSFPAYHCVENPCQDVSERVPLKENRTATKTGRSVQAT